MNQDQNFTEGPILRKMLRFMVPILLALILQSLYSAVDLLIVGRFGTTEGISGVSTGASILHAATVVISAMSTAVTVLMGQYLGQERPEKIGRLLGRAVAFFFILSIVLSALMVFAARPIAVLMQAPPEALDLTVTYIRICGAGFIFVVFYNVISGIFRGLGNSRLPLLFVGIACVVNIFGDLFLVAVLKMDVAGAAIATIAAQALSVIIFLMVIRRQTLPFTFRVREIGPGRDILDILRIGSPLAVQEVLTNLTFLALMAFINRLGLEASSGYGVAQRIQSFIMLIPGSIMQCMAAFVAQNVGAGDEKRAQSAMKCGMCIGATIGVFIAVAAFFAGDRLSMIFTEDPAVIARSFEYLRGFAIEAVVTPIVFSYLGYFNGHGQSLFVMIQGLVQSFCIRLPVSYLMSIRPNASLTGIGFAAPTATIVGIVICTCYYLYCQRKRQKEASGSVQQKGIRRSRYGTENLSSISEAR